MTALGTPKLRGQGASVHVEWRGRIGGAVHAFVRFYGSQSDHARCGGMADAGDVPQKPRQCNVCLVCWRKTNGSTDVGMLKP